MTNSASLPVSPAIVTVDGQKESWVIVEDPLPANTVFEDIQILDPSSTALVLHKLAEGQYSSRLPNDKTQIGHAVVAYKNPFVAGQKSNIKLTVKTQPLISYTTLVNEAYVLYQKGQVNKKTPSNTVETKVVGKPTVDSTTNDFKTGLYTLNFHKY